jgi:hypothetical protein
MTEVFKNWADVYFDKQEGHCDNLVPRDKAYKDFEEKSGQHKWTMNKFTRALKAWSRYTDYVQILNPKEFHNTSGRIIRKEGNEATEMIYIQTKEISAELKNEAIMSNADSIGEMREGDKPF